MLNDYYYYELLVGYRSSFSRMMAPAQEGNYLLTSTDATIVISPSSNSLNG